jgi:hypothetical protein
MGGDALTLEEFQTFVKSTLAQWSEGRAPNTNNEDWCLEWYEGGQDYEGAFEWESQFYTKYGLEKASTEKDQKKTKPANMDLAFMSNLVAELVFVSIVVVMCCSHKALRDDRDNLELVPIIRH